MIETLKQIVADPAAGLTLYLGALYAAIWFVFGGLWTIRQVRRGRLVIPPD